MELNRDKITDEVYSTINKTRTARIAKDVARIGRRNKQRWTDDLIQRLSIEEQQAIYLY